MANIGERSGSSKKVQVNDLLKALSKKPKLAALPKAVDKAKQNGRTLDVPLEKPQALQVLLYKYFCVIFSLILFT